MKEGGKIKSKRMPTVPRHRVLSPLPNLIRGSKNIPMNESPSTNEWIPE